jgi:hypothetical protein
MADSKNRCFWSKVDSRGICISADYAEVRGFTCHTAADSGLKETAARSRHTGRQQTMQRPVLALVPIGWGCLSTRRAPS